MPVCSPRLRVCYARHARPLYAQGLDYATEGSAGMDLRACPPDGADMLVEPGQRMAVPTGVSVEVCQAQNPENADSPAPIAGFVYSRSGLGAVKGLTVAQGVGVIDPDYRGEITVYLLNTSSTPLTVSPGERIAQLIFQPFVRLAPEEADSLSATERGAGGFGHTGRQ